MGMMTAINLCVLLSSIFIVSGVDHQRKVYIAYMGFLPEEGEYSPSLHHSEILNEIIDPSFASKSLIRSYQRSFNGFAAYLSEQERQKLASFDGILTLFPCEKLRPQTTRSWDFMGISERIERRPAIESDVIIGVIDSGIWPESESFNDKGLGPVPRKWKGGCHGGQNFTCNRKIIGARCYSTEKTDMSARDTDGHGTHVASIVAGNEVKDANYYGLARGIARGGVPSARLATYKVCENKFCDVTDLLSAFDDAIADGVDIISISLTQNDPVELTVDPIAIGAFHAMERGILTVTCAGNLGPSLYSVTSFAPWIFTVAASNIDRRILDKVLLGDGTTLVGDSINAFPSSDGELLPLVYGQELTSSCLETEARNCDTKCLESSMLEQKVVICDKANLDALIIAGARGCIIPSSGYNVSQVMPLPVASLSQNDMNLIRTYKSSTKKPTVEIFKSEDINNPTAPRVALFSSRGPTRFIPDIVKPDIIAPGVEILAAFSPLGSPSGSVLDKMSVKYNILSGTSMACPHVAAAAAFVKSFHPEWSPSAIKSALMTTAWEMNPIEDKDAEFAYGSGHIDPVNAKDPGLVYETSKEDYLKIWCNISKKAGSSTYVNASCPTKMTPKEINYPSMAAQVDKKSKFVVSFPRTVTNVGRANSTYVASIKRVSRFHIFVNPNSLQFTAVNQKMSFVVSVRGKGNKSPNDTIESVSLLWTDGIHRVRSPIVVYTGRTSSSGEGLLSVPRLFCTTFLILLVILLLY